MCIVLYWNWLHEYCAVWESVRQLIPIQNNTHATDSWTAQYSCNQFPYSAMLELDGNHFYSALSDATEIVPHAGGTEIVPGSPAC